MADNAHGLEGVITIRDDGKEKVASPNLTPGVTVYGERILQRGAREYRLWSPYRSKLSAAILNGLKGFPLRRGGIGLYLGAASGTTASHVSDIIGPEGVLYCVEFAPRPMKELLRVAESRMNLVPLLADARRPETYSSLLTEVEFIYQDVAQPRQAEIYMANARAYLSPGGRGMLILKSRSVDVAKEPQDVFREEIEQLEGSGFSILQQISLDPYDKDHVALVLAPPPME